MLYLICPERPELVCRLLRVLLPLAESTLGNGLGAKAVLLNTSEHANLGKELIQCMILGTMDGEKVAPSSV